MLKRLDSVFENFCLQTDSFLVFCSVHRCVYIMQYLVRKIQTVVHSTWNRMSHYDDFDRESHREAKRKTREKKERARRLVKDEGFDEELKEFISKNGPVSEGEIEEAFEYDWFVVSTAIRMIETRDWFERKIIYEK